MKRLITNLEVENDSKFVFFLISPLTCLGARYETIIVILKLSAQTKPILLSLLLLLWYHHTPISQILELFKCTDYQKNYHTPNVLFGILIKWYTFIVDSKVFSQCLLIILLLKTKE